MCGIFAGGYLWSGPLQIDDVPGEDGANKTTVDSPAGTDGHDPGSASKPNCTRHAFPHRS